MSVRRNTTNRLRLIRTCYVCGKTFPTTADSPFMRQLYNVDGKKQKTCYFCSESCKNSTYKHLFDGMADIRRQERERVRDRREYNRRYYQANQDRERARQRDRYWRMPPEERRAINAYNKRKRKLWNKDKGESNDPGKRLRETAGDCSMLAGHDAG